MALVLFTTQKGMGGRGLGHGRHIETWKLVRYVMWVEGAYLPELLPAVLQDVMSRKLEWRVKVGLNPRHFEMGCGISGWSLNL